MKLKPWKISIFLIAFLFLFLMYANFIGFQANKHGSYYNKSTNAVWIAHKWVEADIEEYEVLELIDQLESHKINTVFLHVGPILEDGTVEEQVYEHAERFVEIVNKNSESIEVQAWLGQIRSKIDLSDPYIRSNIVKTAEIFTLMLGFDAVHYDIEPVWDGDTDFIVLLGETREKIGEKKISVALAEYFPKIVLSVLSLFRDYENYNTETNYQNVAEYADQIVTMVYDTGIDSRKTYEFLVKEETIQISNMLEETEFFIAIPSYDEKNDFFDPDVENIESGLKGIIKALNNSRMDIENFAGVAVYPNWKTSDEEWEIYDNLWTDD